jgi:hypothetical protein
VLRAARSTGCAPTSAGPRASPSPMSARGRAIRRRPSWARSPRRPRGSARRPEPPQTGSRSTRRSRRGRRGSGCACC